MRQQTNQIEDALIYGKVPPQAKEMEKAVLGAILLEKSAMGKVEGLLKPEMFYVDANMKLFQAFLRLGAKSRPIDTLEVIEELKMTSELEAVGGPYAIMQLTNSVVSGANVEYHAQKVLEMWKRREVIKLGMKLIQMGYDDELTSDECMVYNEKALTAIGMNDSNSIQSIDQVLVEVVKKIEAASSSDTSVVGVSSGYKDIDFKTHGWQKGQLIILAARPAVGKTALALNFARNASVQGVPVAYFSLEMTSSQLCERMVSAESGVFLEKLITGNLNDHWKKVMFTDGIGPLSSVPVFFDDTAGININQLRSKSRELKRKHGIGMIVVDYLQLMSSSDRRNNREGEISEISRSLKGLAKELDLPIIALSQLSRAVEQRENKEPKLSDLRESGAIEQDADTVMFIYRPEYYDINTNELGEDTSGLTIVSIAKNRSGKLGKPQLRADLSIQRFFDWDGEALPAAPGQWKKVDLTPF